MDIVIVGAGGHGRVVLEIVRAAGQYNPIGFLDADPTSAGQVVAGLPVLGPAHFLHKLKGQKVKGAIVAIGDNHARRTQAAVVLEHGLELINAIHPRSIVSPTARLGRNVVVAAGAVVGTDTTIADSVIVNTAAVIDHECQIGEAVHVCPAAALAGRVRVGEESFLGLGCRIIQCLNIGSRCIVGAGAVVTKDVADGTTVVGVPARAVVKARVSDAAIR